MKAGGRETKITGKEAKSTEKSGKVLAEGEQEDVNKETGRSMGEKKPDSIGIQTERILAEREQDGMNAGKNPPVKNFLKNLIKTAAMITDRKAVGVKMAIRPKEDALAAEKLWLKNTSGNSLVMAVFRIFAEYH
jgi:hypothetical protein